MKYRVGDRCFSESHGSSMKINLPRFHPGQIDYNMREFCRLLRHSVSAKQPGGLVLSQAGAYIQSQPGFAESVCQTM